MFTKIDKLNQKERNRLKKSFEHVITISNLKKMGYDNIHKEILKHIFGMG